MPNNICMKTGRFNHFNKFTGEPTRQSPMAFFIVTLLTLMGCKESNDIENLFDGGNGTDTEIIEVPPENNLSIAITSPASDGETIGYEKEISGTCGTVGLIVQIEGDVTAFSVCGVDLTWQTTLDTSSVPAGTVSIDASLVDGDTVGNPATRTFTKTSTACDTEIARSDTFANFSTTGVPPWQICTPTQLANIGTAYQGDDIEIMNDLDFGGGTFSPLGDTTSGFSGTLEGNNFTISNFAINSTTIDQVGIFRQITGGTVQNLNFENVSVRGDNDIGLIAGRVDNGDCTIQNVNVTYITLESLTTGNSGYVGGLIGRVENDNLNLVLTDINVTGITITSDKNYQAGVVGHIEDLTGTIDLDNIQVVGGDIQGRQYVGGIVGSFNNNVVAANTTLDNISNSANVTASTGYGGGITGSAVGIFTNVSNSGDIKRTGSDYFGGIAGYYRDGSISGTRTAATRDAGNSAPDIPTSSAPTVDGNGDVVSCYNTGDIIGGSGRRIGGIIGFAYRNFDGMTSCYNTGEVTGGNEYVGGLLGYGETAVIDDSFNTGDVTGEGDNIGGIAGRIQNNTSNSGVTNSYSSGKITSNDVVPRRVAGIIGDWEGSLGMTDVWFNGEIEALNGDDSDETERIGGIVGSWDTDGTFCTRCDSAGTLTVSISAATLNHRYFGGINGLSQADIVDSSSSMDITVYNGEYAGGLVGYDNRNTIATSTATGNVTGRRYVGGFIGYPRDTQTTISDSSAEGDVEALIGGGADAYAGGFSGRGTANITRSYASGNVTALDGNYVGGFEGGNSGNVNRVVNECFATGDVDAGTSGIYVGGFVGRLRPTTDDFVDNFATGNVRGSEHVGGFVGYVRRQSSNAFRRNYVVGQVFRSNGGTGADSTFGPMFGTITNNNNAVESTTNFYNTDFMPFDEASSLAIDPMNINLINVNGLSDADMSDSVNFTTNFVGFDFTTTPVWATPSGSLVLPGQSGTYQYPVQDWVE